jgi:hypothetical protein
MAVPAQVGGAVRVLARILRARVFALDHHCAELIAADRLDQLL